MTLRIYDIRFAWHNILLYNIKVQIIYVVGVSRLRSIRLIPIASMNRWCLNEDVFVIFVFFIRLFYNM